MRAAFFFPILSTLASCSGAAFATSLTLPKCSSNACASFGPTPGRLPIDVAQIFDPKRVISRTHLIGAYLNALYSFSERRNIAKNASTEMLLFAAMTRKITDAITLIGAKSSSDFILFCSDLAVSKKVAGLLSPSREFRPAKPRSSSASHFIGIENDDEAVLQRMALSRL